MFDKLKEWIYLNIRLMLHKQPRWMNSGVRTFILEVKGLQRSTESNSNNEENRKTRSKLNFFSTRLDRFSRYFISFSRQHVEAVVFTPPEWTGRWRPV